MCGYEVRVLVRSCVSESACACMCMCMRVCVCMFVCARTRAYLNVRGCDCVCVIFGVSSCELGVPVSFPPFAFALVFSCVVYLNFLYCILLFVNLVCPYLFFPFHFRQYILVLSI